MKKMNIGIVGLGVITKFYFEALKKSESLELRAVCDIDVEKTVQKAAEYNVLAYTSLDKMLLNPNIDAVIVTLPNHLHAPVSLDAMEAGKHVMCEKPLATKLEDAEKLVEASKRLGKILYTCFHRRYNSNFKDLVADQYYKGKIVGFHARYNEKIENHSGDDLWYMDIQKSGGGCVIDNGINVIDVLTHIVGPMHIIESKITYDANDVDMQALLTLGFNGGSGTLELDWAYDGEAKDIKFMTQDGMFVRDFLAGSTAFKGSLYHEYERGLDDFALSVRSNRDHGEKGYNAQRLITEAYIKSRQ